MRAASTTMHLGGRGGPEHFAQPPEGILMALRSGHGNGTGRPHVEVLPADELPGGTPAPTRPAPARDKRGRFLAGAGTSAMARRGAQAAHEARQLGQLLGLKAVPEGHPYAPYARLARQWRDDHMRQLAATVGGGEVGPAPASVVSTAALQLAASRWLGDVGATKCSTKLLLEASRLADASRQNLLAAHELCAREAEARSKRNQPQGPRAVLVELARIRAEGAALDAARPHDAAVGVDSTSEPASVDQSKGPAQ